MAERCQDRPRLPGWLDGTTLHSTTDTNFPRGEFGIGYHDYFATNANILGTYADNFQAGLLAPAGIHDWRAY